MPINPFRAPANYDVPNFPAPAGRWDPSVFSNIAGIGESIGAYRDQQAQAALAQGALGPDGQLDMNKYTTALALSGRNPAVLLRDIALMKHQAATEANQKALLDLRKQEIEQGKTADFTIEDQLGLGPAKRLRVTPDGKVRQLYPPLPDAAAGKQSALDQADMPQAATLTAAASDARLPANFYPAAGGPPTPNEGPEDQPPYQVAQAGPGGVPVPTQRVPAPPAVKPERERKLQKFMADQGYGPEGADAFRDILDYKAPLPADDKLKGRWIRALRSIDDTFDPNKYDQDKKRPTLSPEMAARLGMAGAFALELDDQTDEAGNTLPGIRSRIKAGELNKDYSTALQAQYYKGGPGEIRKIIDGGAESLIRMLTGAGMNKEESAEYGNRYKFRFVDNPTETLTNVDQLARTLKAVEHAVSTGKTDPEELRKILGQREPSKFTAPSVKNDQEATQYFQAAQARLKRERERGASPDQIKAKRDELVNDLRGRKVPYADTLQ